MATLEIPQSRLCNLPVFHRLTANLLAHLPRFWDVYNSALADYRRQHGVRSHAHPAPELAADGDWLEAPYWFWTDDNPRRRRVFVRSRGDELLLSDREGLEVPLQLSPEREPAAAIEQLAGLAARGIRLRSRALLTTLAARLLLGDLFLHGIGGAKYDRLTDAIIQRFFYIEPPAYMVVSGTLHLPIAHRPVTADDLRSVEQQVRQLVFHPEQFIANPNEKPAADWTAEKRRLIDEKPGPAAARDRCRAIRRVNESLQPWVAERRGELTAASGRPWPSGCMPKGILSSRDYGFCLDPEKILRGFLLDIPGGSA